MIDPTNAGVSTGKIVATASSLSSVMSNVTVTVGTVASLVIETNAAIRGAAVNNEDLASAATRDLYAAGYDADGNFTITGNIPGFGFPVGEEGCGRSRQDGRGRESEG